MITRDPKPEGESRESKPADGGVDADGAAAPERDDTSAASQPKEIGGRKGPDPTRFGDWEKGGRCIDF